MSLRKLKKNILLWNIGYVRLIWLVIGHIFAVWLLSVVEKAGKLSLRLSGVISGYLDDPFIL